MKHYENKYYAIDIPSTHQLSANDDSDKGRPIEKRANCGIHLVIARNVEEILVLR